MTELNLPQGATLKRAPDLALPPGAVLTRGPAPVEQIDPDVAAAKSRSDSLDKTAMPGGTPDAVPAPDPLKQRIQAAAGIGPEEFRALQVDIAHAPLTMAVKARLQQDASAVRQGKVAPDYVFSEQRRQDQSELARSAGKAIPRGAIETAATGLSPYVLSQRLHGLQLESVTPLIQGLAGQDEAALKAAMRKIHKAPNFSRIDKTFLSHAARSVQLGRLAPEAVPEHIAQARTDIAKRGQEAMRGFAAETFPIPKEHEERLPVQVGRGVGSAVDFVATRLATGPLGLALFAGSVGSGEAIENAIAAGATDEEQARAGLMGIAPGLTDMIPVERLLKPIAHIPGVKGAFYAILRKALEQGAIEGTQEGVQQAMQNLVSQFVHTPEREWHEGVVENGFVGMLVGVLFGAGAGGIQVAAGPAAGDDGGASQAGLRADTARPGEPPPVAPAATEPVPVSAEFGQPIEVEAAVTLPPGATLVRSPETAPAPVEVAPEAPVEPTPAAVATGDVPTTLYRGSGREDRQTAYSGAAIPIMGAGRYFAFTNEAASSFGPNVKAQENPLKNPLVIRSDDEWKALAREAGWKFPNPYGLEDAEIEKMTADLQALAKKRGHDGIVVYWDDATTTDIDSFDNRIKTLRNVFGVPQVVVFGEEAAKEPAQPAPYNFRERLESRGAAVGENDASYKIVTPADDVWTVERVRDGQRDTIVGMRGDTFASRDAAISWAAQDQRAPAEVPAPDVAPAAPAEPKELTSADKLRISRETEEATKAVAKRAGKAEAERLEGFAIPEVGLSAVNAVPILPRQNDRYYNNGTYAGTGNMVLKVGTDKSFENRIATAMKRNPGSVYEDLTNEKIKKIWPKESGYTATFTPELVLARGLASEGSPNASTTAADIVYARIAGEWRSIDARLYAWLDKKGMKVKAQSPHKVELPFLIEKDGETVGVVMGMKTDFDTDFLDYAAGEVVGEGPAPVSTDTQPGRFSPSRLGVPRSLAAIEAALKRQAEKTRDEKTPKAERDRAKVQQRAALAVLEEFEERATAQEMMREQWSEKEFKAWQEAERDASSQLSTLINQHYPPSKSTTDRRDTTPVSDYEPGFWRGWYGQGALPENMRSKSRVEGYEAGKAFAQQTPPAAKLDYEYDLAIKHGAKNATMHATVRADSEVIATLRKRFGGTTGQRKFYSQGAKLPKGATLTRLPTISSTQALEPGEKYISMRADAYNVDQVILPPKEEPLTREAVIAPLAKDLGVPIYRGRVKGARLGFFRPATEEVRIKNHADIEVAAHEVAHLLDKRFPEIRKQWNPATKKNAAIREELRGVSYDKKKLYEGFAEFVRLWSTQKEEAAARAPKFYEWFEGFVDRNRHGPALRLAQEQMHAWFDQSALDRARSKVGHATNMNEAFNATFSDRFRQGALDDLQAIMDAEKSLTGEAYGPIYQGARLTRGASGTLQAALFYGAPAWRNGQIVLLDRKGQAVFHVKEDRVERNPEAEPWGLEVILVPVSGDLQSFGLYAVGRRAQFLKSQGRENLFTRAEITAMLALETPVRKEAFEQWNDFNRQILDFAQQSGLIDPETRSAWETAVYLPFWRVTVDKPQAKAPGRKETGEVQVIKRLRGGTANIGDPIANMHQNTRMLLQAAIYNQARRKTVDMITSAEGVSQEQPGGARFLAKIPKASKKIRVFVDSLRESAKERYAEIKRKQLESLARSRQGRENPDIVIEAAEKAQQTAEDFEMEVDMLFDKLSGTMAVWQNNLAPTGGKIIAVMRRGKAEYYEVADELMFHSLNAMPRQVQRNEVVRFLNGFRRFGQRTVTWTIDFVYRNIVRDQVVAGTLSRNGYRPFIDAARGFRSRITRDATYQAWLANGGGMASFWSDEEAFETHLRTYYEKHGIAYEFVINKPRKFMYFVDRFFDAFESATRIGELKRAMEHGKTLREGTFESREVSTDFAMRGDPAVSILRGGDAAVLGFLYDTVLFLKAGTVGVDRVYRGFAQYDNKAKVAMRTGMVALAGLALFVINRLYNADEFDELEDWDRDLHWHIWIPDGKGGKMHFRFPKPWEIGGIATITERAVEGVIDKEPEQALKSLNVIREMFRYEVFPFAVQPLVEQAANRQFFFDRPIEPPGVADLEPWARATPYTSETVRAIGEATRGLPRGMQLSPARIEHLLRGYFTTWAHYGLTLSDQVFFDDIPALRADQYPLVRSIYRADPPRGTRFRTEFYDMLREATETRRTMRAMDRQFRPDLADELEVKRQNLEYSQLTGASDTAAGINGEIRLVTNLPDLEAVQDYATELAREKDKAQAIARLRLSKHWKSIGPLKRELVDIWLAERNKLFKEVVKDVEAQRAQSVR